MIGALVSFSVVAGLMTITPGLDTALVLRTAARGTRRAAFATALGINSGVLVWALAAAVGVSALLTASETAYTVLRFAGALYMLYLGARMIRGAMRGEAVENDADAAVAGDAPGRGGTAGRPAAREGTARGRAAREDGTWRYYRQGLATNLLNPKIGAFYVALLPQFIPPEANAAAMGVLLGLVHNVEGLVWFTALILAVRMMSGWLRRPGVQRGSDAVAGAVAVGFGVKLALSPR